MRAAQDLAINPRIRIKCFVDKVFFHTCLGNLLYPTVPLIPQTTGIAYDLLISAYCAEPLEVVMTLWDRQVFADVCGKL